MSKEYEQNKKDLDFWLEVIKSVTPLADKKHKSKKDGFSEKNIKKTIPQKEQLTFHASPSWEPKRIDNFFRGKIPGLDRSTSENLRKGKIKIEGNLDLHGYGYDDAKKTVEKFVEDAYFSDKRCVLIITGKGGVKFSKTSSGIIKQSLPAWINQGNLKNMILGFSIAKPKDGGDGAFYVLLRRKK